MDGMIYVYYYNFPDIGSSDEFYRFSSGQERSQFIQDFIECS